jgi:hypothetical protein
VVKEKLVALETRGRQDTTIIERLHKEWDRMSQAVERLRSERNMAHT